MAALVLRPPASPAGAAVPSPGGPGRGAGGPEPVAEVGARAGERQEDPRLCVLPMHPRPGGQRAGDL